MIKRIFSLFVHSLLLLSVCRCAPDTGILENDKPSGTGSGQHGNTGNTFLDLTPATLNLSCESQEKMVAIHTNAPGGWHVEGSTVDWMSCRINADHIMVCVEANNGSEIRTTEIAVTAADVKKSITVVQNSAAQDGFVRIEGEGYSCVLNDNACILPEESVRCIQNVDLKRQIFHVPAEHADRITIKAGTNVVINTPTEQFPEGLLARIQEVIPTADGGYDVSYSTAALLDCFKDFDVSECDVDLSGHLQKVLDKDGNEIRFEATKSIATESLHVVLPQIDIDLPLGCSITPKMEADITMKTQIKAENYYLSTMNVIMDADCTIGADISAECDYTSMTYKPRQKMVSFIFGAIPVGPLVITPTLDIYTIAMFDMKLKMEASVSYKRSFRTHVHYDEAAGLEMSARLNDEEPDALKMEIGPKLEGSVTYGIGIGPGISLYGGALGVGASIEPCISESLSAKFDIMNPKYYLSTRKGSAFPLMSINPTYDFAYQLTASANLYGVGFGYSASTPPLKFPVRSCPVAPTVSDDFEITSDGDEVVLRTRITGGQSLFYGPIVALLYNSDNPNNVLDYISCEFDFDREKYERLADTDEVEITARTYIDPGKRYNVDLFTEIGGVTLLLRTFTPEIKGVDKRFSAAVRAILRDIRASAVGEWKGCNWDDNFVMVGDYENVEIYKSINSDKLCMDIDIPEEWKLSDYLKIGPHTDGVEDLIEQWELDIHGDGRHFSKVEINDPLIERVYITDHVDSFSFHSELSRVGSYNLPKDVVEMDLSHCLGLQKSLSFEEKDFPNLKKVTLKFTPVEKLFFKGKSASSKIPEIELENTELELFGISYMNISGYDLTRLKDVKEIAIDYCTGSFNGRCNAEKLKVGGTFSSMVISGCANLGELDLSFVSTPSVVITGNPVLSSIDIFHRTSEDPRYKIDALSITDCPAVKEISCYDSGISSLQLANLPSLTKLNCADNHNLTGVMLPIFDELKARNAVLVYDQRYTYRWDSGIQGYTYTDNGYGFYYQGEPESGRHQK